MAEIESAPVERNPAMEVSLTGAMPEEPSQFLKDLSAEIRSGFVRKVYSILFVQLLITAAIAWPILAAGVVWVEENSVLVQVANVTCLVVMIGVMCCCQKVMIIFPQNYIFLLIITVCMGIMVGSICAFYSTASVTIAAAATSGIVLVLTAYACFTKSDFTGSGPFLLVLLISLTLMGVIGIFVRSEVWDKIYAILGAMLFSFYIIFDTQLIVGGGHKKHQFSIDQYVFAALNIYLDIINLFLFLLEILGKR